MCFVALKLVDAQIIMSLQALAHVWIVLLIVVHDVTTVYLSDVQSANK